MANCTWIGLDELWEYTQVSYWMQYMENGGEQERVDASTIPTFPCSVPFLKRVQS